LQKRLADLIPFVERQPYGIKDARVRELILGALQSGDSSKAGFFSTPGSSMMELRWLVQTVRKELPSIKQPTLLIHPREDDRSDMNNSMYLQRHLGGLVDMVVLDDSYHIITLDRQRHIVIDRTNAYASWIERRFEEKQSTDAAIRSVQMRSPRKASFAPLASAMASGGKKDS
jgi:carboxylesterase